MNFNWKTTTGGIIAILSGLGDLASKDWMPGADTLGLFAAGIALLFGKDHDATGGKRVIKK